MSATRDELVTGGILGLILGGLVTFALAHQADDSAMQGPEPELAPLQVSDVGSDELSWRGDTVPARAVANRRAPAGAHVLLGDAAGAMPNV